MRIEKQACKTNWNFVPEIVSYVRAALEMKVGDPESWPINKIMRDNIQTKLGNWDLFKKSISRKIEKCE